MHAATPRIGIQTTIFSEHEIFEDCCHLTHFYPFDIFAKKCENNEKIGTQCVHVARNYDRMFIKQNETPFRA